MEKCFNLNRTAVSEATSQVGLERINKIRLYIIVFDIYYMFTRQHLLPFNWQVLLLLHHYPSVPLRWRVLVEIS